MTDGQLLFAVFSFFYLLECLYWLPLTCSYFSTWALRRGWSAKAPVAMLSAPGKGIAIAWPFPLLGGFVAADAWPVIPDDEGLWTTQEPVCRLNWAQVSPRLESQQVHLAQRVSVCCASAGEARLLHSFLHEAKSLEGAERLRRIESWWRHSVSLREGRAAIRRYRIATSVLRWPCVFVFFLCFIWLPYLFVYQGGGNVVLPAFASLFLTGVLVAFTWRFLDRRIFPDGKRSRWAQVLHLIVMPAHTIRAPDLIGSQIAAGLHPLAIASSLLPKEALTAFAAQTWRSWRYIGPQDPLAAAAPLVVPRIQELCQRLGLASAELEQAPGRQPDTQSYCPRCQAQFQLSATTCKDCNGTETVAW